jgi:hypothetical protein
MKFYLQIQFLLIKYFKQTLLFIILHDLNFHFEELKLLFVKSEKIIIKIIKWTRLKSKWKKDL